MTGQIPKPFVQAACVCEKVLIEPDNVASLIRIIDTYNLNVAAGQPLPTDVPINLTAFVSLKSGDLIGEHEIGLLLRTPAGKASPTRKWPVVFNGEEHGAILKIEVALAPVEFGLYWFDVMWGNEVLTRIPFRLKPKAESTASGAAPSETTTN